MAGDDALARRRLGHLGVAAHESARLFGQAQLGRLGVEDLEDGDAGPATHDAGELLAVVDLTVDDHPAGRLQGQLRPLLAYQLKTLLEGVPVVGGDLLGGGLGQLVGVITEVVLDGGDVADRLTVETGLGVAAHGQQGAEDADLVGDGPVAADDGAHRHRR